MCRHGCMRFLVARETVAVLKKGHQSVISVDPAEDKALRRLFSPLAGTFACGYDYFHQFDKKEWQAEDKSINRK